MGLSSNARLLTITARLTSNEYESQQIANAKMRLATQSQEASANYINALNTQQLLYTNYDEHGDSITQKLTAGAIYQYSDMKPQYVLANSSGKALISQEDAYNFEKSENLEAFLANYGLKKEWKSPTLKANYEKLESPEFVAKREAWDKAVQDIMSDPANVTTWEKEKSTSLENYQNAIEVYRKRVINFNNGIGTEAGVQEARELLAEAKQKYSECITFDNWANTTAALEKNDDGSYKIDANGDFVYTEVYKNMEDYNRVLDEYNAEAEDYGSKKEDLYTYNDANKARWYTNLWYRLNGESTDKSRQGKEQSTYSVLDEKLLNSTTWIQDALTKGGLSIEVAKYVDTSNQIPDINNPTVMNLKGITWKTNILTSLSNIIKKDDDKAIARAEAEYKNKTEEINAKDEKYQNKIKILDTEHTALQQEYQSVQSALNKNIQRSFKTFNG